MIENHIKYYTNVPLVCFRDKSLNISHSTKDWIDAAVIGNVVAEISHGREKNRTEPDCINQ
ncbi:hypothetical protein DSECCO2_587750 [anaerobic digester metagenome]